LHRELDRAAPFDALGHTEAAIVCFSVRSAVDASLQGVELRAWLGGLGAPSIDLRQASRRGCARLEVEQLEWVLGECAAAQTALLRSTRIWMPLSVGAIARPWVKPLLQALTERPFDPALLTVTFSQGDVQRNLDGFASCVDLLGACQISVSLSEVDDLAAVDRIAARVRGRLDDVRLAKSLSTRDMINMPVAVARLRRQGMRVTALDISSAVECESAIEAGVDLLQGDAVGLPYEFALLEDRIRQSDFAALDTP
jgi:EAL domain-containing protein (putative c-di-GMP-specific phosphodiesterase class I)